MTNQNNRSTEKKEVRTQDLTLADVSKMLGFCDHLASEYEGWIKVGSVLKSWHEQMGLDLWDAFSSRGRGYNPRDIRAKWGRLDPASVGVGFLIKEALRGGMPHDILKEIRDRDRNDTTQSSNVTHTPTSPQQAPPDKNDAWRLKAIKSLYADYRHEKEMESREIIAAYMRWRGIELTVSWKFLTLHGVKEISVTKEKQRWAGIIAEIRDCLGEFRGYHVIYLKDATEEEYKDSPERWVFSKAPIAKEEQKKSYRMPLKSIAGAGVWLKPTLPEFRDQEYKTLVICEGIETAIALYEMGQTASFNANLAPFAFLGDHKTQIVACLTAGNMASLTIPLGIERVCLFVDIEPSRTGVKNAVKMAAVLEKNNITYDVWFPPNASPDDPTCSIDWHDEARALLPLWRTYRAQLERCGIVLESAVLK